MAKMDYCSIDIEGGELELLQLIGIENIDATIFSVENALQNGYFNQLNLGSYFAMPVIL
ncbi:MAG: FkbM family methyltransferase [Saprospiraceae bacterium]|nr:FkbM family methyltransferase [Saprospiraceae bacterium]